MLRLETTQGEPIFVDPASVVAVRGAGIEAHVPSGSTAPVPTPKSHIYVASLAHPFPVWGPPEVVSQQVETARAVTREVAEEVPKKK